MIESEVSQYTTAVDEIMNLPVEQWSKATKEVLAAVNAPTTAA